MFKWSIGGCGEYTLVGVGGAQSCSRTLLGVGLNLAVKHYQEVGLNLAAEHYQGVGLNLAGELYQGVGLNLVELQHQPRVNLASTGK